MHASRGLVESRALIDGTAEDYRGKQVRDGWFSGWLIRLRGVLMFPGRVFFLL